MGMLALRLSGVNRAQIQAYMCGEGHAVLALPCRDVFQLAMVPHGEQVGLQANRVDLHPFKPADPVVINLGQQFIIRVIDNASPLVAQLEEFDKQSSAAKAGIVLAGSGDLLKEPLQFPGKCQ